MKEFLKKLGRSATGRKGIGNTVTVAIIIAVVMLNILAYTLTSAFGLYVYSPEKYDLSISGSTDELFAKAIALDKKVTVTFCYGNADTLAKHDTGSLVLTTAREFEARYPDLIDIRFVNLLTKLDENGLIVDFDKYLEDGKNALKQSSVIFESGEGEEWSCRVLTDTVSSAGFIDFYTLDSSGNILSYNGEEVMAAMISWVLQDEHPVAYFTQNHGETADVAFSNLLTCAGYYVEVINLRKSEIPEDAGLVIISNPTSDFEMSVANADVRGEINKLDDYLENGGKLYVALDPYVKKLTNLEGLLEKWGITISGENNENGVLVRDIVRESSNAITTDGYTFVATHANNNLAAKVQTKVDLYGNDRIIMSEVARLELDPSLGAQPLLVSGSSSPLTRAVCSPMMKVTTR